MKAFVDIGSHNGQTILKAIQTIPDCDIYIGIEPVISLIEQSKKRIPSEYKDKVIFVNLAIDCLDSDMKMSTFYEDINPAQLGSSLISDKIITKKREIEVLSFDVLFFFDVFLKKYSEIILKIDIEGKEYDILEKLLTTNILKERVKKLYIEWHWYKTSSISEDRHKKLVLDLNNIGVIVTGDSKKDEFYNRRR